ncbi:hypothetical protein D3C72_1902760 [compost metagenome]
MTLALVAQQDGQAVGEETDPRMTELKRTNAQPTTFDIFSDAGTMSDIKCTIEVCCGEPVGKIT